MKKIFWTINWVLWTTLAIIFVGVGIVSSFEMFIGHYMWSNGAELSGTGWIGLPILNFRLEPSQFLIMAWVSVAITVSNIGVVGWNFMAMHQRLKFSHN